MVVWWWGLAGEELKVVTLSKKVVTFLWERKGLYGKESNTGVNGKGCESITNPIHAPLFPHLLLLITFKIP